VIQSVNRKNLWFERSMAIIATIGFAVAMFDLTYIPWRGFYFKNIPQVTQFYDPYKGIEPHRETERYLNAVEQLRSVVKSNGLESAEAQSWLQQLDTLSVSLIQNNPFQTAGKTGNLEKIKNEVRDRVGNQSAKGAFATFWSQPYLIKAGWDREINFYDRKIKPLIVTNYYRGIDESGDYIDRFWEIDLIFITIFAGEFIGRNFYIRRHNRKVSWQQAIIWRWYDLILLLPVARYLRIIPVIVRWQQAQFIDLELVRLEVNRLLVGQMINDLTDAVVIQVLQKMQSAVKQGQILKLAGGYLNGPHIDLNNINEIAEIVELILEVVVYRVIPKIQPDLEAIFRHLFHQALLESPAYRNLQLLPGIGELPAQAIDRIVKEVSVSIYTALTKVMADPERGKLGQRLVATLTQALGDEIQRGQTIIKIESLLYDLIEEIKVTYTNKL
jgi:hypothetical protein